MRATLDSATLTARAACVKEHVRCENAHDLNGIMKTFGAVARYDDEPWNDHRVDLNGVRTYYEELLRSVPDLQIDVRSEHVADDVIILEVIIRGTHAGKWRGCRERGGK